MSRQSVNLTLVLCAVASLAGVAAFITAAGSSSTTLNRQLATAPRSPALPTVRPNLNIQLIAHRGASRFAPENTLAAIDAALELRFNYVELDVRSTWDGVPVVLHDATVNRTTNGSGAIAKLRYDDVRRLDAGSWFDEEFAGERIPTLEEALQRLAGNACALWDTKAMPTATMVTLFKKFGFDRNCLLVTFGGLGPGDDTRLVKRLLALWPEAPIMPTVKTLADVARVQDEYPQARAVRIMRNYLQPELIDTAHAAGLLVFTSTLIQADVDEYHSKAIDEGADFILLDNAYGILNLLGDYPGQ